MTPVLFYFYILKQIITLSCLNREPHNVVPKYHTVSNPLGSKVKPAIGHPHREKEDELILLSFCLEN
jgi:hypothetical protein